jgi:hypothetical protein
MFVPTCATCHMSGLNGQKVTHDPSDRLSYYVADPITSRGRTIELFALFNFAGLVVDIFLAHSTNQFRERSEYLPLFFSAAAAVALAFALGLRSVRPAVWRAAGHVVGWDGWRSQSGSRA